VLVGERGAYRVGKPLQTLQAPATVQAVLAARINRLPPEEKRLLQTGAVIGTEVPFALLEAIAEMPDETLRRGLMTLQAAEFLYETSLFPELEYTFKHALTHEVVYGSLLQERRRTLHGRIVDALERLYPDRLAEQVERLAHHALRGEVWDKAVTYCCQAWAKAVVRSANREAAACFEQALRALLHLSDRRDSRERAIDLRFDLRIALLPLGEYGRIHDVLHEAEAYAKTLNDQRRLGLISAFMVKHFRRVAEALPLQEQAIQDAAVMGILGGYTLYAVRLSESYRLTGRLEDASTLAAQALVLSRTHKERGHEVYALRLLAEVAAAHDSPAEAESSYRQALSLAEDMGMRPLLAHCHCGLGKLYVKIGRRDEARAALATAIGLYRAMEMTFWLAQAEAALAEAGGVDHVQG
jgi:predicted ATPase